MEEHLLTCSFKSQFGVECLGCGTQRSVLALLRGDIVESFLLNPGVLLMILTVLIGAFAIYKRSKYIYRIFVTGVSLAAIGMVVRLTLHLI
tara:strand:- start:20419 stop:20691 length:273 start_codon:yes stop_codon:yes gene_type:complete